MTRLQVLDPKDATGKSKELFDGIQSKLGMVPNMMKTMGNSPAVLEGYLGLSGALSQASIGGKLNELIALAVSEANGCDYCLSAHSFIGEKLVNIDTEALELARSGKSHDPKIEAALTFAISLVKNRGNVTDEEVQAVKDAGYSEGAIGEIIANVALNVFTNYFNITAGTVIDFPLVQAY